MARSDSCVRIQAEGRISKALGGNELGMSKEGEEGPGAGNVDTDRSDVGKVRQVEGPDHMHCGKEVGFYSESRQ